VVSFLVNPSNLDAYYIDADTYQLISRISLVLKVALGVSLVALVIGVFVSPILVLEMFFVLHVGFFSIALLQEVQPTLATVGSLSIGVNGYN